MKYNEFCLINFYANELLESIDMGTPSQQDINRIENLLLDNTIKPHHPELQKLIVYDFPEKKALLIEKDLLLQKAHHVLISNMGFSVDIATSKEAVINYTKNHYDAVFTRPQQQDLTGILNTTLFTLEEPKSKIFIYITPEEKNFLEYFTELDANTVLELPLSSYWLYEALSRQDKNQSARLVNFG